MKAEAKSPKRLWRWNVLDVAIVLVLIASIASIGYRYYQTRAAAEEDHLQTVQLSFSAHQVLPGAVSALAQGDAVYLADTQDRMGTLVAHPQSVGSNCPVFAPSATLTLLSDKGDYVKVAMPEGTLLDVQGTVRCQGTIAQDGSFLLNGRYVLTPGESVQIYTERVQMNVTVNSISILGQ